jgi:hypothetical protein
MPQTLTPAGQKETPPGYSGTAVVHSGALLSKRDCRYSLPIIAPGLDGRRSFDHCKVCVRIRLDEPSDRSNHPSQNSATENRDSSGLPGDHRVILFPKLKKSSKTILQLRYEKRA